jgi:hypothetical protein
MTTDNFFTEHPEVTRYILAHETNSIPTISIPVLDLIIHTEANGYTCDDPECPCQDDYEEYWQPFRQRDQARNATMQCADGSWW